MLAGSQGVGPWTAAALISLGGAMANFLLGAAWTRLPRYPQDPTPGVVTASRSEHSRSGRWGLSPIVAV